MSTGGTTLAKERGDKVLYNFMYNELLKAELTGVYGDLLKKINQINRWYEIYDGKQEWEINGKLDYEPTKKVTNLIKKLINTRARFMFGSEPYFNIKPARDGEEAKEQAEKKEELLYKIFKENKFHSKLLKARKDCSIGGSVAIKLWARQDIGIKIVFVPAQEFFVQYNVDDIDQIEKVIFVYAMNDEDLPENQRIKKQVWELVEMGNGTRRCILNEATYNGKGEVVSEEYVNHDTQLDFIPVIVITNRGLTGETEGKSDVEELWDNQDAYNKLTSDDIDALRFQMFGQDVFTDASEDSLKHIKIAPGAIIDLQTDLTQNREGRQAKVERLESKFSYKDKFEDTINRIKNDMYEIMDVPNVSLEQLKGLMQSGKSMKALYWGLMAACEEDWTEWGPALEQMVDYIFKMVETYNLYGAREIAKYETVLEIQHHYPLHEDEEEKRRLEMDEVQAELRSRQSYIKKWSEVEDVDAEIRQIQLEKQMLQDSYTQNLLEDINEGNEGEGGEE